MSEIKIFAPSFKRAKLVKTHEIIPDVKYVVKESQAQEYSHLPCWVVPDEADSGGIPKIRNYILDQYKNENVLLVDDDISAISMWKRQGSGWNLVKQTHDEISQLIENGFNMAEEMGVKLWGLNVIDDKGSYREYSPFSLSAFIGSPWAGHVKNDLRYDERLPLKEDYDMTLQVMNKYRRVLRLNWYVYTNFMHEIPGGCSTYRTLEREKENLKDLQRKWGSKIVSVDNNEHRVTMVKEREYDINPIIRIPIKGI